MRISDWSSDVCSSDRACRLPLWMAPLQAVVAPIVSDCDDYAQQVADALDAAGLRVDTDLRNEKINYKIRELSLAKVPVILVVGKKEAEQGTVTLRRLGEEKQETIALADALARLTRPEEHTSELPYLMRISYAVFCLQKTKQ